MCGDCWNAAMGAPVALAMGRLAWVGHRDRIPFLGRARSAGGAPVGGPDHSVLTAGRPGRGDGDRPTDADRATEATRAPAPPGPATRDRHRTDDGLVTTSG